MSESEGLPRPGETLRNGKRKAVIEALAKGNTRRAACEAVGIDSATFYRWINSDAALCSAVTRAEADAEQRMVDALKVAADGYEVRRIKRVTRPDGTVEETEEITTERDWRAAESYLKRRHPQEWGDRLDLKNLPDDVLTRLLERALNASADPGGGAPEAADTAGPAPTV